MRQKVIAASGGRSLRDLARGIVEALNTDQEDVIAAQAAIHACVLPFSNPALRELTPEQQHWLEMIRDHIAANLGIEIDDFEYAPFNTDGGLGKVHHQPRKCLPPKPWQAAHPRRSQRPNYQRQPKTPRRPNQW